MRKKEHDVDDTIEDVEMREKRRKTGPEEEERWPQMKDLRVDLSEISHPQITYPGSRKESQHINLTHEEEAILVFIKEHKVV